MKSLRSITVARCLLCSQLSNCKLLLKFTTVAISSPSRAATARLHRQNEAQCATHRLKGYRSSRSHRTSFTKLTNLFKTSNSLHTSLSFLLVPIKRPTGYQTAHSRHQDLSLLNAQFQECQDMRFRSSHDFLHTSLSFCQLKDQLGIELLVFYVKISHYLMHNFKYSVQ